MADIRDIRADLQARIDLIAARRRAEEDRHNDAMQAFDHEEEMVKAMLELEGRLLANDQAKVLATKPLRAGAKNREESEVLEILSNADEWEHSEIRSELLARGVGNATDPNFGRGLQGMLLSLRGRELLELTGPRKWRITAKGLGRELPLLRRRVLSSTAD